MWKTIEEFPTYEISTSGKIKRKNSSKVRKPFDNHGYDVVGLNVNGTQINRLVHRLVATTYLPNPMNKTEVNHIDGDKRNNCVSNLEWVTASENLKHSYDTGLRKSQKILTPDQVASIKQEYVYRCKQFGATALGLKYGVSRKTILRALDY